MCLVCSALNLSIKRNAYQMNFILNYPLLFHAKVTANLKGSRSPASLSIFAFQCSHLDLSSLLLCTLLLFYT